MTSEPANIIHLSEARQMLAKANTVDEVKQIRDKAEAVRMYARAQGMSLDLQNDAAEMKIRAERKAGELLANIDGLGIHGGDRKSSCTMKLESIGIDKMQSHRWQRIATVSEKDFERHITETKAARDELTTAGMLVLAKHHINGKRKEEVAKAPDTTEDLSALSGQKFATIYADPPWRYGNQATRASTDNHYATMTVEEIAALPIGDLAADRAHLWLWTTNGFLFECPKLFDAWGFEFKSSYVWVKTQFGIGNYLRNAHELLLLATRGGLVGAAKNVRSWDEYRRAKHSAKPEEIRTKVIERVSPGPRLELFGRARVPGWTVWGNQIERSLMDDCRV